MGEWVLYNKDKKIDKNKLNETIFLLSVGVTLVWSISTAILSITEFITSPFQMFINIFFVMLALRIIFSNKYTISVALAILIISTLILFVDLINNDYTILYETTYFLLQIMLYLNGLIPYYPIFETIIMWSLFIILGLFVFTFSYLWFNFIILFLISSLIFTIILTSGFFYFNIAFYAFIFCTLSYLIKSLNIKSFGKGSLFALYALPISIFSIILASLIPTPQDGFTDQVYNNLFTRPFTAVNRILHDTFRPKYFSLAQTGFNGNDVRRLGGNVTTNYNVVMRVQSNEPVLYLTGSILDTYTGYAWVNTLIDTEPLMFKGLNINLLEQKATVFNVWNQSHYRYMPYATGYSHFASRFFIPHYYQLNSRISIQNIINLSFERNSLNIDTLNYSSFSVFYTDILVDSVHAPYGNTLIINGNDTITSYKLKPRGTLYTLTYYSLPSYVNVSEILRFSYNGLLQDVYNNLNYTLTFHMNGVSISYADLLSNYLIPRANHIYEVYTQLPYHFPQRVIDLANYVTYGARDNYTRARMLEAFLRQFEYTLTPGPVPIYRDFVDYFLFDKQRGYCTYYASAFVTMARALGIPTRYVEGFIAVGNDSNYFYIRNRQGHAWAEVYFEGFGWHRFDPTPPSDTFGAIFSNESYNNNDNDGLWQDLSQYWLWWQEDEFMLQNMSNVVNNIETDEVVTLEVYDNVEHQAPIYIRGVLLNAVLILFSIAIVCISLRVVWVIYGYKKINKKSNNEAVIGHFNTIIRYLKFFNYEKEEYETSMDFVKRANKFCFTLDGEKYDMVDVTSIFLKAKYSKHKVTSTERFIIEGAIKYLDDLIKSYISKYKYYAMKYVFYSI